MLCTISYVSGTSACAPSRSDKVFCPFFNLVACLLRVELCEFFIYFGDQTLVQSIICKYSFPYDWFSFHFNAVFFSHAEAFYFDEIPFIYSSFMFPALGDIPVKILLCGISEIFLPMFFCRTFMVSWLLFKSFIQLEFIFVYGVSWWLSLIFLHLVCLNLPTLFVEEAIFTPFLLLPPLSDTNWP